MPHISYVDPATVDDPELQAVMERARAYGTPPSRKPGDPLAPPSRDEGFQ